MRLLMLLMALSCAGFVQAADATVKSFERNSLKTIEAAQGAHPYWLVLWDLDCVYCVQSLKNLAAAQKKNPSLRIVTVATDDVGEREAIAARLRELGVSSEAYAFGSASPVEALRYTIDPAWRGEKPRAYFYRGDGQRRAVTGVLDEAIIFAK